jgi:hypothetical protein
MSRVYTSNVMHEPMYLPISLQSMQYAQNVLTELLLLSQDFDSLPIWIFLRRLQYYLEADGVSTLSEKPIFAREKIVLS